MTVAQWIVVVANAVTLCLAVFIARQQRIIRRHMQTIRDLQDRK